MAYMPSPEQEQGPGQEDGRQEQEPVPYYKAAQFKGERPAGEAYFQAQAAIFETPDCDLSVYRFQINRIYHLTISGDLPSQDLEQKIQRILSTGESVSVRWTRSLRQG